MCNSVLIELIENLKKQDKSSLEALEQEFGGLICFFGKKLGGGDYPEELKTCLLEILCSINTENFKPDNSNALQRYIAASLRNRYIALSKEKQKYEKTNIGIFDDNLTYTVSLDERIMIKDMLNLLSKRQRDIITYRYIYGYSDIEISRFLNISRQAVNRLKLRAINTIREYYNIEQ